MKRAKPDAKSDDFGAVWTQVRRRPDSLKRAKPDAKSDDFGAVCTQQAAPGRLQCEYEIRIQMVGRGSTLVLDDFEAILSI